MKYVSIDGDDVGRSLTQMIYLSNNDLEIINFSKSVVDIFENVKKWIVQNGGKILFCAGDSIFYRIDSSMVEESLSKIESKILTVSVGIGNKAKEAHWALNVAKSLGKNRVVNFENIKHEIFGNE